MTYLVAVSGGVDSVVLLDMLSRTDHRLVVAHVDHGIRGENSAADARFVEALARQYGVPYVTTSLGLGAQASEAMAREQRYAFLYEQAGKFHAEIVTAHHLDDVVETIAINCERGTGWRGLAVLSRDGITRPLLSLPKTKLYAYARDHHLEWVEDETNKTDSYHRNRLRAKLGRVHIDKPMLARLRVRQLQLRKAIEMESKRVLSRGDIAVSRYFFTHVDETVAVELLGTVIESVTARRLMRPQLIRALHAIKTMKPGSVCEVGEGVSMYFTSRTFEVKAL